MRMTEEMIATVARQRHRHGTGLTFGDHQISLQAPFARLSAAPRRLGGRLSPLNRG